MTAESLQTFVSGLMALLGRGNLTRALLRSEQNSSIEVVEARGWFMGGELTVRVEFAGGKKCPTPLTPILDRE